MVMRVAVDMKLFDVASQYGPDSRMSISQLAESTGADAQLVGTCLGLGRVRQ